MKWLIDIIKESIVRFKAKSPEFFNRLQKLAYSVGISSVAMIVANKTFELGVDVGLISALGYVACVCAGIAGTAKLTKE